MAPTYRVVLVLGSNIEPERHLPAAVSALGEYGAMIATSPAWQFPAIGALAQADFVNVAVLLETPLDPVALKERLRALEAALGRTMREGPRTIDIDLVLIDDRTALPDGRPLPGPEVDGNAHGALTVGALVPDRPHPHSGRLFGALALAFADAPRTRRRDIEAQWPAGLAVRDTAEWSKR